MQNIEKAINTLAENILKVSKDTSSSSNFDVTLLGKVKQKLGNNQYIITLKNEDFTIKSVCAYEFSVGDLVLVLQINNDPKNKVIIGTYSSINPSISQSCLPLSGGTLTGTSGIENRNPIFQWRLPDGKIYYISAGGTGNTDYFDLGLTLGDNNATVSSMIKFNKDGAIDYVKDPASARAALGVTSELSKKQDTLGIQTIPTPVSDWFDDNIKDGFYYNNSLTAPNNNPGDYGLVLSLGYGFAYKARIFFGKTGMKLATKINSTEGW